MLFDPARHSPSEAQAQGKIAKATEGPQERSSESIRPAHEGAGRGLLRHVSGQHEG